MEVEEILQNSVTSLMDVSQASEKRAVPIACLIELLSFFVIVWKRCHISWCYVTLMSHKFPDFSSTQTLMCQLILYERFLLQCTKRLTLVGALSNVSLKYWQGSTVNDHWQKVIFWHFIFSSAFIIVIHLGRLQKEYFKHYLENI